MIELKVLDPDGDEKYFCEAWEWQFDKPKFWQELFAIWQESREEFLAKRFNSAQVDIGVFLDDKFSALITLEETYPGILEVHFDCARGAKTESLREAILTARAHVFSKGARELIVFVCDENKTIKKLIESVGFKKTHAEILFGEFRSRVVRWHQYILTAEDHDFDCQNKNSVLLST